MISYLTPPPRTSRRDFLRRTGMGFGSIGLASVLGQAGALGSGAPAIGSHFAPRAKRVVHFFMNGGPSQVDTFDPKPILTRYDGKPLPAENLRTERKTGAAFGSPFKFSRYGQSGLEISELFAKTAAHADDIAVIRSMVAQAPNHEPSLMLMNCGDSLQARPSVGSWVLYGLGSENNNLPGFISMCPGGYPIKDTENWQSAFLPGAYQGTYVDSKHTRLEQLIENIRSPHATAGVQQRQLNLLRRLDGEYQQRAGADPRFEARLESFDLAFRMQTEATDAFDIMREPEPIREMYGSHVQGRQTLIARRLLERGVRFVQLWHGGSQPWDNHDSIEANHRRLAAEVDQPIAALIADLKQRGMFEDTLIIWGGEFGRTPSVELNENGKSKMGRDHNHYGFSVCLAGGGIKGGTAYGATDDFGFRAVENPTTVHDLHATMLHCLGFDHTKLTYRHAGRDFRLTDVSGEPIQAILT